MVNVLVLTLWHAVCNEMCSETLEDYSRQGTVKVTAVYDVDEERGRKYAQRFGADFEPDVDKALARADVDAVINLSPMVMHKDLIIKAARAGKAIYTEPPIALTLEDAKEVRKVIDETGVLFVHNTIHIFDQDILLAKKIIDAGYIGKIVKLHIRHSGDGVSSGRLPDYWTDRSMLPGGAIMDMGPHGLEQILYLMGGTPERISAFATSPYGSQMRDEFSIATLYYADDAIALLEAGLVNYRAPYIVEIVGTDGSFTRCGDQITVMCKELGTMNFNMKEEPLSIVIPKPQIKFLEACIRGDKTSPENLGIEFAEDMAVVMAKIEDATASHSIVEL